MGKLGTCNVARGWKRDFRKRNNINKGESHAAAEWQKAKRKQKETKIISIVSAVLFYCRKYSGLWIRYFVKKSKEKEKQKEKNQKKE